MRKEIPDIQLPMTTDMKSKYIDYPKNKPSASGQYKVDTNHGKTVAFWVKEYQGNWFWMLPNEDYKVKSFIDKL